MERRDLEKRTKEFALRLIRFVGSLPKSKVTDVLGYQLLKSGTSIGANYREANRAESHDDFIHKIGIVEKEASESQYWLELIEEVDIGDKEERGWLVQECGELVAIFTAMGRCEPPRHLRLYFGCSSRAEHRIHNYRLNKIVVDFRLHHI